MGHDYATHCIPKPIIKEGETITEDVAGNLTTTRTLVGTLIGQIEGLQDIARRMKERPDSISPDAWKGRIEEMWALGETVSSRLNDDIALLYAQVEADNERPRQ